MDTTPPSNSKNRISHVRASVSADVFALCHVKARSLIS